MFFSFQRSGLAALFTPGRMVSPPASLAAAVSWTWANQLLFSRSAGKCSGRLVGMKPAHSFLGNFEEFQLEVSLSEVKCFRCFCLRFNVS